MNLITKIACLALLIGGSTLSAQPVDCRSGEPAPQGGPTGEVTKSPNYPVRGTATIPTQQGQQCTAQPRGQAQPCTAQPRGQVSAQPAQRPVGNQVQGQRCDQNQNQNNVNQNQNNNNANQNKDTKAQNNNVKMAPAAMNNGMTQGQTNNAPANNNSMSQDKTAPASKDAMSK